MMSRFVAALLLAATLLASLPASAAPAGRDRAIAQVRRLGYRVENPVGFESEPLQVLVGVNARSGDGYAKKAFFFYRGRYLGTDTSQESASILVMWQDGETVALMYVLYRPQDPMCCPTGGGAIVRYHWNGARLVPLDPIPPVESGPLSRR